MTNLNDPNDFPFMRLRNMTGFVIKDGRVIDFDTRMLSQARDVLESRDGAVGIFGESNFGTTDLFDAEVIAFPLASRSSGKIVRPPGTRVSAIVRWLPLSKATRERIFGQIIADMRDEYVEALAADRTTECRLILARGYLSLAIALFTSVGVAIVKGVIHIWKLGR